jgi:hypothetical protein
MPNVAGVRFPFSRVLLARTRLAYVHLHNLLHDAKRDRILVYAGGNENGTTQISLWEISLVTDPPHCRLLPVDPAEGQPWQFVSLVLDPEVCTIDCAAAGRAFNIHMGEGSQTVIQAITIQNGSNPTGGGMYIYGSSPRLLNCIFRDCRSATGEVIYT